MNTVSLIKNFICEEFDEFKKNLSTIINIKIDERKAEFMSNCVEDVFRDEKTLNNEGTEYSILPIINESIRQNHNISLTLKDSSEVLLKPHHSKKILEMFDKLNRENQISLIDSLIESEINFNETVKFCTKFH
jgi:hypothetical protein